jgi:hypothetical protein
MKTVEQWLNTLEEPYKSQALFYAMQRNFWSLRSIQSVDSLREAVTVSFIWETTEQGWQYWLQVAQGGKP